MNEKRKHNDIIFDYGKIPPQAVDLEEAIIALVLSYYDCQNTFIKISKPEYFYKEHHQIIAKAIIDYYNKEKVVVDELAVINQLKDSGDLNIVGGAYYISQLTNKVSGKGNFEVWCRKIQEKWMQREVIRISSIANKDAFEDTVDVFNLIDNTIESLKNTLPAIEEKKTLSKSLGSVFANIMAKNTGKIKSLYEIGDNMWDDLAGFGSGITMIAASGKVGKTTFITYMIKKLLKIHYERISVMWITIDHEDANSTIRKFISNELRIADEAIQGKKKDLDADTLQMIEGLQGEFIKYDIIFEEDQMFINEIRIKFIDFCLKRKDRFNILIIDNIMKLRDYEKATKSNTTEIENRIASVISNIYNQTRKYNSQVIYLHHLGKEQIALLNAKEGYRPRAEYVRGSCNLMNVAEQTILLNRPGKYFDILLKYPEYKHILKHLFIVEIVDNTFGEEDIIYYFSNLKYNDFREVECINNYIQLNK